MNISTEANSVDPRSDCSFKSDLCAKLFDQEASKLLGRQYKQIFVIGAFRVLIKYSVCAYKGMCFFKLNMLFFNISAIILVNL